MSSTDTSTTPVTRADLQAAQQALTLLRGQVQARRIDAAYLEQQLSQLSQLLARLDVERAHTTQERRYAALFQVSQLLGTSLELQTVLNQVMDAVVVLTGAERGFLMLRNDDGELDVVAARNIDQQTLDSSDFRFSRTAANDAIDRGEAVLTTNATEDPRYAAQPSILSQALRSLMVVPLRARGAVIGVVYVDSRATVGLFDEDDLAALEGLAGQASMLIENARLFAQTDQALAQRLEELRRLRRVDLLLNETLDAQRVARHTLEWATNLAHAHNGWLALVQPDGTLMWVGLAADAPDATLPDHAQPAVEEALATHATLHQAVGRAAQLVVPIHRKDDPLGVLVLVRPAPFAAEQIDLAERVAARAALALDNARLFAQVQAADQAKSEFVSLVAHELKAPMNTLSVSAGLVLLQDESQANLTDRQRHLVRRMEDTVARMAVLVTDLADVSRIESGHFRIDAAAVPLPSLLDEAVEQVGLLARDRQHTLQTQLAPGLPPVWADGHRLLQVLGNLLGNAVKYTPPGGTIVLRAALDGAFVQFTVADNGVGMAAEDLARLGTKFWRASDPFTRAQEGTGLGYAIARALVERMGGALHAASAPGLGSTFTFTVPVARP